MQKGSKVKFDRQPIYLGVALDRNVTLMPHLQGVANNAKKKANLKETARELLGCQFYHTPLASSPSLVFSTAEYATPVRAHSLHLKLVGSANN